MNVHQITKSIVVLILFFDLLLLATFARLYIQQVLDPNSSPSDFRGDDFIKIVIVLLLWFSGWAFLLMDEFIGIKKTPSKRSSMLFLASINIAFALIATTLVIYHHNTL